MNFTKAIKKLQKGFKVMRTTKKDDTHIDYRYFSAIYINGQYRLIEVCKYKSQYMACVSAHASFMGDDIFAEDWEVCNEL